ncbi:MAG: NAD(P) transhydrogenase subunit alpha part 1 [Phycisphaerae bacterium]|nr:NAD(P) transhydrogenase subunit alpha part 1 [Phycisphaerae bacterium]
MKIAVPRETFPGERRVALVPDHIPPLTKKGLVVLVESNAGDGAGYPDQAYVDKGGQIINQRGELFQQADIVVQVRCLGANPQAGSSDLPLMRNGQVIIGSCDPLSNAPAARQMAERSVALLALELVPRITRAQSMDVLSSMATIAGYKAVLLAAEYLPRMFPMLMTAAGTLKPARVFVIGAGVAGLQALGTARRLGAVTCGYDVRPVVKDQVESMGAKFIELPLETAQAEGKGGYAQAMSEEFYKKQRELMKKVVAENDVVITTAAIPGKKSPVLITADMVQGMMPGSVIVDLAAERGGNCELTQADQIITAHGVTILGPTNLPATVPSHASQMYGKNICNLLALLITKEGQLNINLEDEIIRESLIAQQGQIVHPRIKEILSSAA